MSQFDGDDTEITVTIKSPFYASLGCTPQNNVTFVGTAEEWIDSNFTDISADNTKWDALFLILVVRVTRVITFIALTNINHRATYSG
jgi:hypothetical protein